MTFLGLQLYQFVIGALSLTMMFFAFEKYLTKQEGQTLLKLTVRIVTWGGMAIITIFPKVTYSLASIIGIEGNINAAILIGFLLLFLIIFKILAVIERMEYQITLLTRQQALKKMGEKDKEE